MFNSKSIYENDKIKQLIKERDKYNSEIDQQIREELQKEKAKYKTNWTAVFWVIVTCIWVPLSIELNDKIFSADSIWSWHYWAKFFN